MPEFQDMAKSYTKWVYETVRSTAIRRGESDVREMIDSTPEFDTAFGCLIHVRKLISVLDDSGKVMSKEAGKARVWEKVLAGAKSRERMDKGRAIDLLMCGGTEFHEALSLVSEAASR